MKLQSLFLRTSLLLFAAVLASCCFAPRAGAQSNAQAASQSSFVQTPAVPARITQAIDDTQLVRLKGNVHPLARPEFDQGPVPDSTPMNRMLMLLQRSPEQETALQQLLAQQQDKSSANFHKWLTPQQFGAQFGPPDADIQSITDWLTRQGFQGIKVSNGRTAIEFSGNVGQVRNAFHTEIHRYQVNEQIRQANSADPQIPAALTPVVAGIVTLHNFPRKSMKRDAGLFVGRKANKAKPLFTTSSGCGASKTSPCYVVGPADFAKIYNVPTGTLNGTGVTIALVADSNINPQDVADFQTLFGLSGTAFTSSNIILNGPDPGMNGDEGEADLDVQTASMVAPGATIKLVVSEDTQTANGIDLSAFYIVDNNIADVASESFGICEPALGTTGTQFYGSLWEQAAAQGTSVMVSAGDNGSAGCDDFTTATAAAHGLAVSAIASTPFNVAVGGTDFDDATTQTTFWGASTATSNAPPTRESALGYIPEIPWNDSCAATAASTNLNTVCATANGIAAASGGVSVVFAKPSWQSGTTPADGARDLPDVSLFASDGQNSDSFYVVCQADQLSAGSAPSCAPDTQGHFSFFGAGGTSASSPAFAAIIALINQQQSGRQGNPNPVLYTIAKGETFSSCNSSSFTNPSTPPPSTCAFLDITKGNNSVPCAVVAGAPEPNCSNQTGGNGVLVTASGSTTPAFTTGTGYDLATGLGTVNVTNLAAAWKTTVGTFKATTTATKINGATTPVTITHGTSVTLSATVTSTSGTPTGDVSFLGPNPPPSTNVNGGIGCVQIFPSTCSQALAAGTASFATPFLPGGSYTLKAHYAGDGSFAPSNDPTGVSVTVSKEQSKLQAGIVTFDINTGNVTSNPFATSFPYGSPYILRMDILKSTGTCLPFTTGVVTGCAFDATGQIIVTDGTSPLDAGTFIVNSQGHAEDQPIQLSTGSHNISATYSGDISYTAPASATILALTVTQAATSTTVTPSPSSIASGGSITLTANVATLSSGVGPTGTVQFKNGSAALGSAANCVPTAGSASAAASCTATLSTTLSLLPPLSGPNRIPTPPTWIPLAVFALLLILLLNLKRIPATYRRVYAAVSLMLLLGLVASLAAACGGGYGGGGGVHYDSITAVYSGDSNYSGSTSPAVQVTVQ